jgi:hypothetical protein
MGGRQTPVHGRIEQGRWRDRERTLNRRSVFVPVTFLHYARSAIRNRNKTPQRSASSIPYVVCTLVDIALSMNESHILSRITGRVGNVRATSEKPAVTNMDMVPVKSADPLT